jgi:hypothetical protein
MVEQILRNEAMHEELRKNPPVHKELNPEEQAIIDRAMEAWKEMTF